MRLVPGLPRHLPDRRLPGAGGRSMPAAASATSPSSTRGRSRARCGPSWETGSTAATIAWRSARGTSSPGRRRNRPFLPRAELTAPRLADLAALDDAGFRALFRKSAVKRIGRDRFVRNVLIAIGNSGSAGTSRDRRRRYCRMARRWCAARQCGRCARLDPERAAALRANALKWRRRTRTCAPNGRPLDKLRAGSRYGAQARLLGMRGLGDMSSADTPLILTLSSPGPWAGAYRRGAGLFRRDGDAGRAGHCPCRRGRNSRRGPWPDTAGGNPRRSRSPALRGSRW